MDPMKALRAADPARTTDPGAVDLRALDALREGIMMTRRTTPRRRRRLWVTLIGAASVGVLGTAGAAMAGVFGGNDAGGLTCTLKDSVWSVPWRTGDAVADCAAVWAAEGITVDDVVAYSLDGEAGAAPRDLVLAGATLIDSTAGATPAVVELGYSLADWVDGGMSFGCPADEQMVTWVKSEFQRLNLTDWTVKVQTGEADRPCAWPFVAEPGVVMIGHDPVRTEEVSLETARMAGVLRNGITDQCLSVGEAKLLADAQLATLDWVPDPTTAVTDEAAPCARVDMMVGGDFFMRVYGPTSAS